MRKTPYTEIGIRRLKCFRCGEKANQQRQICSDGNQYRPICDECDIGLNELVLKYMGFDNIYKKMEIYKKKILSHK